MGEGWRRAIEAAKKAGKPPCPVCGKQYSEKSRSRYRHFDPATGKIHWCKKD